MLLTWLLHSLLFRLVESLHTRYAASTFDDFY
jgi:hypothetical protein